MLELRPLPAATLDGLRPPPAVYPYFAGATRFPFEPDRQGYDLVNASWLADACLLVYGEADWIETEFQRSPLPAQGYSLGWIGTAQDNRGLVLSREGVRILIFRGTRLLSHRILDLGEIILIHQADLWTDSQFLPKRCVAGGRVHQGFLEAYGEIQQTVDDLVDGSGEACRIWLAGHSLGGALATLAAAHLGKDRVRGLCTFGCPRVGDENFLQSLPDHNYWRVVHREDWVATVPPEWLGYRHGGDAQAVPGSPPRRMLDDLIVGAEGLKSAWTALIADWKLRMGELPWIGSGLADHAPVYYATLLWNAFVRATHQGPLPNEN